MKKIWKELRIQDRVVSILILLVFSAMGINAGASWYQALTPEKQISTIVKAVIGQVVQEKLEPFENEIESLSIKLNEVIKEIKKQNEREHRQILKDIAKQGKKIQSKPGDIYQDDFSYLLREWETLPEDLKTPEYKKIIQDMNSFYYGGDS